MRFLKKLKRVTVLVAQHVIRTLTVIWSFLAPQETADDKKFIRNENRRRDGDVLQSAKPFCQIPGPLPIPFFGSQWLYSWIGPYFLDKLHLANEDKLKKYGPIVKEHYLWNFPIVHLYDKNDIETVLRYSSKYPIRPGLEAQIFYRTSRPDRYKSVGLVNVQGLEWHHLRSKLTTQLASTALGDHTVKQLSIISEELIEKIREERDAENLIEGFERCVYSFGLEVIFAIMLDRRLGALNKSSVPPIAERLMFATENLFEVSHETMYGLPWWKYFPTKSYRKLAECEDIIYDVFSDLVNEALNSGEATETQALVLKQILTAEGVDTRDKIVSLIDLIAAGIETTGNATLFLLHNILNNPEVKVRVYEELDRVLLSPEDAITPPLLLELKYLKACITESLRMTPVAPNVARILEKPFIFQGYHVPAGTLVVCETWVASVQEENYLNAKCFIPERWLDNDKANHYPFLAVPFGVGRRMCPGKRIAEHEMLILSAKDSEQLNRTQLIAHGTKLVYLRHIRGHKHGLYLPCGDKQNKIRSGELMKRSGHREENKRITKDMEVVLKSHDCPYVVQCLGCFETKYDVWICMELMATCFDKLLKRLRKPIIEPIIGKIAVATFKALHYLRETHRVIHRDFKPSNILLDERGNVKLCDFDISGWLEDSKAKTRSAGCSAYMAPERIESRDPSHPDYDIRADV